ncbi:MAG TPA: M2 family metallopeptidase, partial [Polyangiaceae bacterium]
SASPPVVAAPPGEPAPTIEEARAFVDDVEAHLRTLWPARDQALWVNATYVTDDTGALASAAEEAASAYVAEAIVRSRRFDALRGRLPPDVARKLALLPFAEATPVPPDAAKRVELSRAESVMTTAYETASYCPPDGSPLRKYLPATKGEKPGPCLGLDELEHVLERSRRPEELLEAWRGWHASAAPLRKPYARSVELANEGARAIGFADVGELWRSGYEMPPAEFEAEIERLWQEVKPLYEELHCYVRSKLQGRYGRELVPDHAPVRADLLGNLWAQEWTALYDLVAPYPGEASLDVGRKLAQGRWDARRMVQQGESFFTGLGFAPLPESFWARSLFTRPRDREVDCHSSASDVSWAGDLRLKMCIEPTEDDLVTVHHELGHDHYFQSYGKQPILFQRGANDGFQEAVGDAVALSVTPAYLKAAGLLDAVPGGERSRMNHLMKRALDKVAFLPFGLLVDRWRWEVFAGKVGPDAYEGAWQELRTQYQGVRAPVGRTEDDFDPGAKYHVATGTPYVAYFLARIYQFQFHAALCRAAGFSGPLDACSIAGSAAAGERLRAVLALGASRPWPDALEALGAGRKADAAPMLSYFAPLRAWLAQANRGAHCGW